MIPEDYKLHEKIPFQQCSRCSFCFFRQRHGRANQEKRPLHHRPFHVTSFREKLFPCPNARIVAQCGNPAQWNALQSTAR